MGFQSPSLGLLVVGWHDKILCLLAFVVSSQDKGVLLTTYDIVRNNSKSLRGDYYFNDEGSEDSVTWDYMILDEVFSYF